MEIWNGSSRSVHFFSQGASTGDETALRDLQRAENDLALANDVQSLRRQYLMNQRVLAQRLNESIASWAPNYGVAVSPSWYDPYGTMGVGAPYQNVASAGVGPYMYGQFGPAPSPGLGTGLEGVLGDEFSRSLAQMITPQATTNALRAYDSAVTRVADSKLGSKIGLVKRERTIGPAVTLILKKDNEKISGNLVSEDDTWITVETAKEEVSIRKADVDRIVRSKSDVKPASR
jgi:hypothetical protein